MKYGYVLFDGVVWYPLYDDIERMDADVVIQLAEEEVADWDYAGISQRLDVYETSDQDVYGTAIGSVETPGRLYQCRACLARFPHPPQELAVCRCGRVATHDDLEPEGEEEEEEKMTEAEKEALALEAEALAEREKEEADRLAAILAAEEAERALAAKEAEKALTAEEEEEETSER